MIDFTSCEVNKFRAYGGANGNKINILYEGSSYILKFPPVRMMQIGEVSVGLSDVFKDVTRHQIQWGALRNLLTHIFLWTSRLFGNLLSEMYLLLLISV